MKWYAIFLSALWWVVPSAFAQFSEEEVDAAGGVLNPSNFSWHYYVDQMNRFPDRLGIICYNAYIVEKAGLHAEGVQFYQECANRGSSSAMIQMSIFYDTGVGVEQDPNMAAQWLHRAAVAGHPWAQQHYGERLIRGEGVAKNEAQGRIWLQKAAKYAEQFTGVQ